MAITTKNVGLQINALRKLYYLITRHAP